MMRIYTKYQYIILFFSMFITSYAIAEEEQKKWLPHVDINLKYGNKRDLGRIGAFAPITQTHDTLTYVDFRFMADTNQDQEGNFGLGHRWLNRDMGYITGVYGYFDRRLSNLGNKYSQLTFGAEYLSTTWDYRGNVYLPESKTFTSKTYTTETKTTDLGRFKRVETSTDYVHVNKEVPLRGLDIEVGRSVPGIPKLRLYTGGYYYQGRDGVASIKGKQMRSTYALNDYISLQAEFRHDNVRKKDYYIGLEVHIPIGAEPGKINILSDVEKRMTEAPIRDVDIISSTSESTSVAQETNRDITIETEERENTPEDTRANTGFFSSMFCMEIGTPPPPVTRQRRKRKQTFAAASMNSARSTAHQHNGSCCSNRSTSPASSTPYRAPSFQNTSRPMQPTKTSSATHKHRGSCCQGAKSANTHAYRTTSMNGAKTMQPTRMADGMHKHKGNCCHSQGTTKPVHIHSSTRSNGHSYRPTSALQNKQMTGAVKKEHAHAHHENCNHTHAEHTTHTLPANAKLTSTKPAHTHSHHAKTTQIKQTEAPQLHHKSAKHHAEPHHHSAEPTHTSPHASLTTILDDTNDAALLSEEIPSHNEDLNLLESLYSARRRYFQPLGVRYTPTSYTPWIL